MFLLLLAAVGILLDGPGGRWIARKVLISQLEKAGLSGSVAVEGHLHSGLALVDGEFGATAGPLRLVKFGTVGLDYTIPGLLKMEINRLFGQDINVKIAPEPGDPSEAGTEEEGFEFPAELIGTIHSYAKPVEIDFRNVSATVLLEDRAPLKASLESIEHQAQSNLFSIKGIASDVLGDRAPEAQDLRISWAADSISIEEIALLPELEVEKIQVAFPTGVPASADLEILLGGAPLAVRADETGSARISTRGEELHLGEVIKDLPIDLPFDGHIVALDLDVSNLLEDPDLWKGRFRLETRDLEWDQSRILSLKAAGEITRAGVVLTVFLGPENELEVSLESPLPKHDTKPLLANHRAKFTVDCPSLRGALIATLVNGLGRDAADLPPLPEGKVNLAGSVALDGAGQLDSASIAWALDEPVFEKSPLPALKGSATLTPERLKAEVALKENSNGTDALDLDATLTLGELAYEGTATVRFADSEWISRLIPGTGSLWRPTSAVDTVWTGSGSMKRNLHKGEIKVTELHVTSPGDSVTDVELTAGYDWPIAFNAESLRMTNRDMQLHGAAGWRDGVASIPGITLSDSGGELVSIEGSIPAAETIRSLQDFLAQEDPLDVAVSINEFGSERIRPYLPEATPDNPGLGGILDAGYSAVAETSLQLRGTPGTPDLSGAILIDKIRLPEPAGLPAFQVKLDLRTEAGRFHANGRITEPKGRILDLQASLPLEVATWAEDPDSILDAAFEARAHTESFDIQRITEFVPQLKTADANLGIDVALSGTIGKPQLGGNLALALKRFPLPNSPLREITDSSIAVRFEGREIILDPSPINAAGGRLTLSGTASLAGEEPAFDVRAKGDHLLVWRNDAFVMRANCDVGLAGSPSKASLTGSVDLVDSLFYKDIEIIPIGVPTTAAPAPKLPKIDTEKRDPLASIPEPYRNWAMDLKLRTADPVLIRGNRARGQVTINAAVGGLVGAPRPSGTLQLRDVEASLPFSRMEIKRGVITLRPEHPFDPSLEVRGFSNVNRTQVSLFLYGPLSNPRFNLVSTPPLPPNEIMTLLATGATTTDLEDTSSASMRAFQLMLDELQHRASAAGNESFSQLLQALSGVQLQVGENDPFSGRSFNSATLQLTDKYYLNAGFDREGNTRSTVIYALGTR